MPIQAVYAGAPHNSTLGLMNTSLTVLATAVATGLVLGWFARPLSWRLFGGILTFGIGFFAFELYRASLHVTSLADLLEVIALSSSPPLQRHLGAIAIAYAALVAAAVVALRVARTRKMKSHEA